MNLEQAYRNTDYIVQDESFPISSFVINIDQLHPELYNHINPLETWTYITAYNPYSKELSDNENESRNSLLKKDLKELGLLVYEGFGRSKNPDFPWQEKSFFVPGISRAAAINLGTKYEQNAIVFGEHKGPAELILLESKL